MIHLGQPTACDLLDYFVVAFHANRAIRSTVLGNLNACECFAPVAVVEVVVLNDSDVNFDLCLLFCERNDCIGKSARTFWAKPCQRSHFESEAMCKNIPQEYNR